MNDYDRLLSPAVRKERQEEARRALRIKLGIGGGLALVILVVVLYFTAFGGKSKAPVTTLNPDTAAAQSLSSIDELIENGNELLKDPTATAAAKAKWQKDRIALEKQRKEILDKHPELKK